MISRLDTDQNEDDREKRKLKSKSDAADCWKGIYGACTVFITNKAFGENRMKRFHSNETAMEPLLVNPYESQLRHTEHLDLHADPRKYPQDIRKKIGGWLHS